MPLFGTAFRTLLSDPHLRKREQDSPDTVTLTFPDGTVYTVKPIERIASEFGSFGAIQTQDYAKIISVSVSEVPTRPPRDTLIQGYADDYRVDNAESDHFRTSWRCNLSKVV